MVALKRNAIQSIGGVTKIYAVALSMCLHFFCVIAKLVDAGVAKETVNCEQWWHLPLSPPDFFFDLTMADHQRVIHSKSHASTLVLLTIM